MKKFGRTIFGLSLGVYLFWAEAVAFAQASGANPTDAPKPGPLDYLWPILATVAIFYFFMLKPQQKEKERLTQINAVEKGDEILTKGGLIGRVTNVAEKILTVEVADQTRVKIDRDFIFAVTKNKA